MHFAFSRLNYYVILLLLLRLYYYYIPFQEEHIKWVNAYKISVGKLEENKPVWIFRGKLDNNIKIDLKQTSCEGVHWIQLAQNGGHGGFLWTR
jgi:hypothetical protein